MSLVSILGSEFYQSFLSYMPWYLYLYGSLGWGCCVRSRSRAHCRTGARVQKAPQQTITVIWCWYLPFEEVCLVSLLLVSVGGCVKGYIMIIILIFIFWRGKCLVSLLWVNTSNYSIHITAHRSTCEWDSCLMRPEKVIIIIFILWGDPMPRVYFLSGSMCLIIRCISFPKGTHIACYSCLMDSGWMLSRLTC